jgi:hypothetical protein
VAWLAVINPAAITTTPALIRKRESIRSRSHPAGQENNAVAKKATVESAETMAWL